MCALPSFPQCNVGGDDVEQVFDQLAKELGITQDNGSMCSHHMHVPSRSFGFSSQPSSNMTCSELYYFVSQMLLRLNVTDECCLVNGTACHDPTQGPERRKATVAEGTVHGCSKKNFFNPRRGTIRSPS